MTYCKLWLLSTPRYCLLGACSLPGLSLHLISAQWQMQDFLKGGSITSPRAKFWRPRPLLIKTTPVFERNYLSNRSIFDRIFCWSMLRWATIKSAIVKPTLDIRAVGEPDTKQLILVGFCGLTASTKLVRYQSIVATLKYLWVWLHILAHIAY